MDHSLQSYNCKDVCKQSFIKCYIQFVYTHRYSYGITSFENEQYIAYLTYIANVYTNASTYSSHVRIVGHIHIQHLTHLNIQQLIILFRINTLIFAYCICNHFFSKDSKMFYLHNVKPEFIQTSSKRILDVRKHPYFKCSCILSIFQYKDIYCSSSAVSYCYN